MRFSWIWTVLLRIPSIKELNSCTWIGYVKTHSTIHLIVVQGGSSRGVGNLVRPPILPNLPQHSPKAPSRFL